MAIIVHAVAPIDCGGMGMLECRWMDLAGACGSIETAMQCAVGWMSLRVYRLVWRCAFHAHIPSSRRYSSRVWMCPSSVSTWVGERGSCAMAVESNLCDMWYEMEKEEEVPVLLLWVTVVDVPAPAPASGVFSWHRPRPGQTRAHRASPTHHADCIVEGLHLGFSSSSGYLTNEHKHCSSR